MPHQPPDNPAFDYEPVTPARRIRLRDSADEDVWPSRRDFSEDDEERAEDSPSAYAVTPTSEPTTRSTETETTARSTQTPGRSRLDAGASRILKRGHALSFAGLFLFTAFLYFRPYELIPSLSFLSSGAFYIALLTLLVFVPSQLALEGTPTARPREVNLILLLAIAALLSLPLAINGGEAWDNFTEYLKVVVMFIVMVNVVRTEGRLRLLVLLVLAASCVLALGALRDYQAGNFVVEGYRVAGVIGGIFGNPNDLALHFATMIPLVVALFLATRGLHKKLLYAACAVLMAGALMVTYSRGGFLGLTAAMLVLAWKLGRRNRLLVVLTTAIVVVAVFALAPGNYGDRMASIFDKSLDAVGSAGARQQLLMLSLFTALRHPLFGVGMGNFHIVSIHEQVSHNAYTQVAAEMGLAAGLIYILFILSPLKQLRRVERETLTERRHVRFFYLAVGLQASLAAYMVSSFFASVAYQWYVYYLVGYAVCLRRLYEAESDAEAERVAATPTPKASGEEALV